jgi:tetratricopeptide (TPR) repeat protein
MNNNICKTALLRGGKISPLIIPTEFSNGTGLTNPSILKINGKLILNIRQVGYSLYHSEGNQKHQSPYGPLVYLNPEDDITLTTRNFLCELDKKTLEVGDFKEVNTTKLDVEPLWEFVGLEDVRLINWDKKLLMSGVRRDTTTNGEGRMEISEVKNFKEIDRDRIEPPIKGSYCEKNWMPILDMPNHYVKWCTPTEIVKVNRKTGKSKTVKLVEQDVKFKRDLRGGSQVVKYKDYWVCITHEVDLWFNEQGKKDAQYYHRFVVWDKDWNMIHHSDKFKFMDANIEFSCGLHIEGDEMYIPFGFQDTTAYILKMTTDIFEEMVGLKKPTKHSNIIKTDGLVNTYVNNPKIASSNYSLGLYYYKLGQFSSALSFFLRAAELDGSENMTYESLLFVAKSLQRLGRRETTELALWYNAIKYKPNRPEAYLFISQYYELREKWSASQTYAKIGLEFKDNNETLNLELGYEHHYQLEFQDALCCWNLGQGYEARERFQKLGFSNYPLSKHYKKLIQTNITSLGSSGDPFLPYDNSLAGKLRFKFKGYKKIERNYSQTYQDMFVLSMLDGKTDGDYLEIGSADPYKGSNTALLEELGWTGLSLEILEAEVNEFRKHRKNPVVLCDATQYDFSTLKGVIDYLQVDCEPPATTFEILTNLPFNKCDFKVITYEHDHYTDMEGKYRELSRLFLKSKGYVLVVGNIAPDDVSCYEDWYVHPKYIKSEILNKMIEKSDNTHNASKYMLNKVIDTSKIVGEITMEDYMKGKFIPDETANETIKKWEI